ncbi:MAG: hypothetical protein KF678_04710 [Phycisphaeraceae bacterium]|nr:hypothetical protein [Phycisphaeraceae bacterium]
MARTGMKSEQARRVVRGAQFAALGLAVAAGALWGLPWLSNSAPVKPVIAAGEDRDGQGAVIRPVSIAADAPLGIAERLNQAANKPPPATETPAPTPTEKPPEAPMPEVPWRYLGPIVEAERTLALVSIEGRQRIVSEGSVVTIKTPPSEGRPESETYRAKVVKVTVEAVEIEERGTIKRIAREEQVARVTWVKPTAPVAGMPTGVGAATGALSPEARARLQAQGIDPQQIERARQVAAMAAAGRNRATPAGDPTGASSMGSRAMDPTGSAQTKNPNMATDGAVPMLDADSAEVRKKLLRERGEIVD